MQSSSQFSDDDNKQTLSCSKPVEDIVFHKTHKCSSSSIQNILLRYAKDHNLTLVLPARGHHLSHGALFEIGEVNNTLWYKAGLQPNIFCLHNRWNGKAVAKLFGEKKPFYFTILRDPISLLISSWDYYGMNRKFGRNLEKFIFSATKDKRNLKMFDVYLKNGLLFDFGVEPSDFGNEALIQDLIAEIDKTFDLILLVENFSESMVLLKHQLCWDYQDLANLRLNAHDASTKTVISNEAKKTLKVWLADSYKFYDYFKVR